MARITQECVARIKDSADIVELLSKYLQLRRAGNSWKACCPFHSEKTPSFHVNPARQTFHCFGCGVGGDALKNVWVFILAPLVGGVLAAITYKFLSTEK